MRGAGGVPEDAGGAVEDAAGARQTASRARSATFRPRDIPLLLLDEHVIAIDKPAGLLSAAGRGEVSAPELLRQRPDLANNPAVRIVHRLDRDASGVQLYARTLAAQRQLVAQFVAHTVEKVYLALVTGYVPEDGEVDRPLRFDRRRDRVVTSSQGKPARTRYRIVQRLAGNTLLECRPETGRLHQIRAHLAAIGYPLTVDPLYGGGQMVMLSHFKSAYRPSGRRPERPLIERLTLHATRLAFDHPATGARVVVESALPKDFRATVTQLERALGGK